MKWLRPYLLRHKHVECHKSQETKVVGYFWMVVFRRNILLYCSNEMDRCRVSNRADFKTLRFECTLLLPETCPKLRQNIVQIHVGIAAGR